MREIKFRGWFQGINGQEYWAYGYLVKQTNGNWEITNGETYWTVDNVGQFTGLKDKNGKEIYEGDILYVEFEKSRSLNNFDMYVRKWQHVVEYVGQGFNIPNIEGEFRQALCTAIHNQNKPTPQWEIIGNIYENPNLLNEHTTN